MLNKRELLLLTFFPWKVDPNLWENEQSGHQGTGVSNSITSSKTSKVLFITPLPSIVSRWGNLDDKWGSQSNRSGKGLELLSVCEQGARELLHGSCRLKRLPHDGGRLLLAKAARECSKQRQGVGPVGTWGLTNNADY